MKTDIKTIASFEIAEALEFKEDEFVKCVDGEIARIKKYSAEKATEYIVEAAEKVDDEEIGILMEAVLQVIISDNVLSYDEMTNLLAMADALDIEHQFVMLMVADLVKTEPELEVSFE